MPHFFNSSNSRIEIRSFSLNEGQVLFYLNDEKERLVIWQLSACNARREADVLILEKGGESVHITGGEAGSVYSAWQRSKDPQAIPGRRISPVNVYVMIVLGIIIVSCLLMYYVVLPFVVRSAVSVFPADYEVRIGRTMAEVYEKQSLQDSADFYIKRFSSKLQLSDNYPIDVSLIASDEINAFALPGGKIYIYTGLIEQMSDYRQLVALLGHEVSHVTERHALRQMFTSMASGVIIGLFFGDFTAAVLTQADKFRELDYSRELETEADLSGIDLMIGNKVNPAGMLDLLSILQKESIEMPSMMKYLSTHPDTEARMAQVRSNIHFSKTFEERDDLENLFEKLKLKLD